MGGHGRGAERSARRIAETTVGAVLLVAALSACGGWRDPSTQSQKQTIDAAVQAFSAGDFGRAADARRMLTSLGPSGIPALSYLFRHPPQLPPRAEWTSVKAQILAALVDVAPGGVEAAKSLGDDALAAIAAASANGLHDPWLVPAAARIEPWILERSKALADVRGPSSPAICAAASLRSRGAAQLLLTRVQNLDIFQRCPGRVRALLLSGTDIGVQAVIERVTDRSPDDPEIAAIVDAPATLRPMIADRIGAYLETPGLSSEKEVRLVSVLLKMGDPARATLVSGGSRAARVLVKLFKDGNNEVVSLLREMGAVATDELSAYAGSDDASRDSSWIPLLGYLHVDGAGTKLTGYATSRETRLRRAAAQGLEGLADPALLPWLMDLQMDEDPSVRVSATRAMASVGASALPALRLAVDREGEDRRSRLVRTTGVCGLLHLGEIGEEALRNRPLGPEVVQCLDDDPSYEIARAAVALQPIAVAAHATSEAAQPNPVRFMIVVYPFLTDGDRQLVVKRVRGWLKSNENLTFGQGVAAASALCLDELAIDLANAPNAQVLEAAKALTSLSTEQIVPAINARLAKETDPYRRATLQSILGKRGDDVSAEAAASYFSGVRPESQAAAAMTRLLWVDIAGAVFLLILAFAWARSRPLWWVAPAGGFLHGVLLSTLLIRAMFRYSTGPYALSILLCVGAEVSTALLLGSALESHITGAKAAVGRTLAWKGIGVLAPVSAILAWPLLNLTGFPGFSWLLDRLR